MEIGPRESFPWGRAASVFPYGRPHADGLLGESSRNRAPCWPAVQRRQCMKQTHQLRRLDQLGQFLTRIKHARFHRGLTDADYFGNLFDGFAVIVNQVDDLAVLR